MPLYHEPDRDLIGQWSRATLRGYVRRLIKEECKAEEGKAAAPTERVGRDNSLRLWLIVVTLLSVAGLVLSIFALLKK